MSAAAPGAPAGAEGPRGPVTGICRNISQGGMFFIGPPLPIGGRFEFWIELPKGKVVATGEVHYAHQYPEGSGTGIHFTRLEQDGVAILTEYIGRGGDVLGRVPELRGRGQRGHVEHQGGQRDAAGQQVRRPLVL